MWFNIALLTSENDLQANQRESTRLLQSLGKQYAPVIFPSGSAYYLNSGTNITGFNHSKLRLFSYGFPFSGA